MLFSKKNKNKGASLEVYSQCATGTSGVYSSLPYTPVRCGLPMTQRPTENGTERCLPRRLISLQCGSPQKLRASPSLLPIISCPGGGVHRGAAFTPQALVLPHTDLRSLEKLTHGPSCVRSRTATLFTQKSVQRAERHQPTRSMWNHGAPKREHRRLQRCDLGQAGPGASIGARSLK